MRTFEHEVDEVLELRFDGDTIFVTAEHPFWVDGFGWKEAAGLRSGKKILTRSGQSAIIGASRLHAGWAKVYNLEVAGGHTYFVGNHHVLVHNSCGGKSVFTSIGSRIHKLWDAGKGFVKNFPAGDGFADAVRITKKTGTVKELKPNNPRKIREGVQQAAKYVEALSKEYPGRRWKILIETYDRVPIRKRWR